MTPNELRDLLIMAASILLSLLFSYGPYVSDWFTKLDPIRKRLLMLCLVIVIAAAMFGLTCTGWIAVAGLACDQHTVAELIQAIILAAIANQTTFQLSPKTSKKARG